VRLTFVMFSARVSLKRETHVKKLTFTPILRFIVRESKAQAMAEFLLAAAVAMVILFVAIQFAVIARDAMVLGQLNYQVTRWATDSPNNHGKTDCALPVPK
jgi:hypothetical protein